MQFSRPFPTAKQLAMRAISVHLANAKLGPYSNFPDICRLGQPFPSSYPFEFQDIVEQIPEVLADLKPELSDVLMGVFEQIKLFFLGNRRTSDYPEEYFPSYKDLQFVFNAYGCLDEFDTWDLYFKAAVAKTRNVATLLNLLKVACYHQSLTHIDEILREIVKGVTGLRLSGPRYYAVHPQKLIMHYKYIKNYFGTPSVYRSLCSKFELQHKDLAQIDEHGIAITLSCDMSRANVHSFRMRFGLLDLNTKILEAVGMLLGTEKPSMQAIHFQLFDREVLETALGVCQKNRSAGLRPVLLPFLEWSHAQFFVPLLNQYGSFFDAEDYFLFFRGIVQRMPEEEENGVIYANLLRQFWSALDKKQKKAFSKTYGDESTFMNDLEMLQSKNPSLYRRIVREICALQE